MTLIFFIMYNINLVFNIIKLMYIFKVKNFSAHKLIVIFFFLNDKGSVHAIHVYYIYKYIYMKVIMKHAKSSTLLIYNSMVTTILVSFYDRSISIIHETTFLTTLETKNISVTEKALLIIMLSNTLVPIN